MLAGVDAGKESPAFYLDTWDRFPQARERLIAQLAEVSNPVVLTGDYHAGMVLDVHARPFDQGATWWPRSSWRRRSPRRSSPTTSRRTPSCASSSNAYGYLTVAVAPEELTVAFRVLDDVSDAASPIATAATWTVAAGDPVARQA
ncbi:MAG: alkaline phosphatase D family protein [Acidimicrobiales bacterium]